MGLIVYYTCISHNKLVAFARLSVLNRYYVRPKYELPEKCIGKKPTKIQANFQLWYFF